MALTGALSGRARAPAASSLASAAPPAHITLGFSESVASRSCIPSPSPWAATFDPALTERTMAQGVEMSASGAEQTFAPPYHQSPTGGQQQVPIRQ